MFSEIFQNKLSAFLFVSLISIIFFYLIYFLFKNNTSQDSKFQEEYKHILSSEDYKVRGKY